MHQLFTRSFLRSEVQVKTTVNGGGVLADREMGNKDFSPS